MRISRKPLYWLTAAVVSVPAVVALTIPTAQAESPDLLPITMTNDSGQSAQTFVYVLVTSLKTGKLGYVNGSGAFTEWSLPESTTPTPAPDVAIAGPATGADKQLLIPKESSGRVYVSLGEKLSFSLTRGGLVQPAPWAAADGNRDILFDWTEFTYNASGLWLNTSMVDMFAVPQAVQVTGASGKTAKTGDLVPDGRAKILDALTQEPGDWAKLIQTRADGTPLRVLSPHKGVDTGLFSATYLDPYLREVWSTYRTETLTVRPFAAEPQKKFTGKVGADGQLAFTDTSGKQVAQFLQPATKDVFGCDGALHAPNDEVVGPIARTLCAALHRSTLGHVHDQPSPDPAQFYSGQITDHYSKAMHANAVDGKAYGFAFDDVGGFESLVHDGEPQTAGITLGKF